MHPLSGEVRDGYVWGRGAVDMKDFDAMLLSVVRARALAGAEPDRPVVLCFTADEEAGGLKGAGPLVDDHPELFEGCTEAVGEVGGFSATVRGRRIYLIEAAEKGMAWMTLTARGRAGHGSMINRENAVTTLAAAVARIGAHQWPVRLTAAMEVLLASVGELAGIEATPENAEALVDEFGSAARMLGAVIRNTTNPTMLGRGLQGERHPDRGHRPRRRTLPPGLRGRVLRHPGRALRRRRRGRLHHEPARLGDAVRGPPGRRDGPLPAGGGPDALVAPYLMSGGTDAKHFGRLGLRTYGFAPLRLPADLDFTALFHGVDERVPTDALEFGARVFDRFLDEV